MEDYQKCPKIEDDLKILKQIYKYSNYWSNILQNQNPRLQNPIIMVYQCQTTTSKLSLTGPIIRVTQVSN